MRCHSPLIPTPATLCRPSPGSIRLQPHRAVADSRSPSTARTSLAVRWCAGTVSDRTTTYVSSTKLTAAILASDIAAAGSASVTVFNPAPGGGLSNAVSFLVSTSKKVYLPLVVKSPSRVGSHAGLLAEPGGDMEFYVTADRGYVDDFAIYVEVRPNCGVWKITHLTLEPITANSFSFTGPFYASGTFSSQTAASGTTGLSSFPISGCG